MSEDEDSAYRLYCRLKDPQTELRCRAEELQQDIRQHLDRAEHGPSPELQQRHDAERLELQENLDFYRNEHENTLLALRLGPDDAMMRGLDCYPPPLDPEYETLMHSLAARQYGEAEAFKKKLDTATESGSLGPTKIAQLRDDYRALCVGFRTETTRYSDEFADAKRLAREWQGLEQSLPQQDKFTR